MGVKKSCSSSGGPSPAQAAADQIGISDQVERRKIFSAALQPRGNRDVRPDPGGLTDRESERGVMHLPYFCLYSIIAPLRRSAR